MKYSTRQRLIHFISIVLIFCTIPLGYLMQNADSMESLIVLYDTHKSIGILILAVTVLRIYFKYKNNVSVKSRNVYENLAARGVQVGFYAVLLAMPITGWLMTNAAGFSVSFLGFFELPNLIAKGELQMHRFQTLHSYLAIVFIALIALHILGALKHMVLDNDNILSRIFTRNITRHTSLTVFFVAIGFIITSAILAYNNEMFSSDAHGEAHGDAHSKPHSDAHSEVRSDIQN